MPLFLMLFVGVQAQNIKKAFRYVDEKEYQKAITIFKELNSKKKDVIALKYGLAQVYFSEDFKNYNLKKSYSYIKIAKRKLERADDNEKKKLEKNFHITKKTLDELQDKILNKALEASKKENTEKAFRKFLYDFKGTKQAQNLVQEMIDTLTKSNKIRAYEKFFDRYSDFSIPEQFWYDFFQLYTFDGEYKSYEYFLLRYPSFPLRDTLEKAFALARQAEKLQLHIGVKETNKEDYKKFIKEAAPKETAFVALQRLLKEDLMAKNYSKALKTIAEFKPFFPKNDERILSLINILKAPTRQIQIKKLEGGINSKGEEFAPFISANGLEIYFCGYKRENNLGGEDIFVSQFVNNKWTKAELLPGLNTPKGNEAPDAITTDGNMLVLFSNGDLFFSKKEKDKWTVPQAFEGINTRYWEGDAMITSDGKSLIFCSDRPGGIGNFHKKDRPFHGGKSGNIDIYISHKTDSGWGTPINLGKTINTPYAERSAFIHADMKNLYFSSGGHGSLGLMDVYKATRLSDTSWTHWSKPVNLGKEINTPEEDWGYRISTDGKLGYFAGRNGNNFDIFNFVLPPEMRPEIVATISGKLLDTKGKPLEVTIRWENLETGITIGESKSNPIDGSYFIVLPLNKLYGYYIEDKAFFPVSGNIDLRNETRIVNKKQDITLVKMSELESGGVEIPLKNIFFDHDKSNLKSESFSELNRVVKTLKENPHLKVEIAGHTDNTGSEKYNLKLSDQRAKAVMEYLLDNGCRVDNLSFNGYGQTKPVDTNKTNAGRANNRRVELRFYKINPKDKSKKR